MARIAIGGFHHETNCFVDSKTDFAYFASHRDRPPLCYGPDVVKWLTGTTFALWGFMKDMAPRHAFERIASSLVGRLSEAMPVDAVYLDLHGAMVTEDFEDGEGELLRRVRAALGPDVPVAISLDFH